MPNNIVYESDYASNEVYFIERGRLSTPILHKNNIQSDLPEEINTRLSNAESSVVNLAHIDQPCSSQKH